MAGLERILKRSIILRDVAGGDIYNSGKYRHSRWKTVELICHNGGMLPVASLWRSGSWLAKTDVSWPTSSCCVEPSEPERRTSGSKQPALNSATRSSLTKPSAKTTRPALWQKKRTAGSQPQPISSKISRCLASNTGAGAVQRDGL